MYWNNNSTSKPEIKIRHAQCETQATPARSARLKAAHYFAMCSLCSASDLNNVLVFYKMAIPWLLIALFPRQLKPCCDNHRKRKAAAA